MRARLMSIILTLCLFAALSSYGLNAWSDTIVTGGKPAKAFLKAGGQDMPVNSNSRFVVDEIRLDRNGGSMENLSILDQGDLGFCFAFSTAQMIDAYRFSHGDGRQDFLVSPLALGAITADLDDLGNSGGSIESAIEYATAGKICSQSRIDKLIAPLHPSTSAKGFYYFLLGLGAAFRKSNVYYERSPEAPLSENPGVIKAAQIFAPILNLENESVFSEKLGTTFAGENRIRPDSAGRQVWDLLSAVCSTDGIDFSKLPKVKVDELELNHEFKKLPRQKKYEIILNRLDHLLHNPNPQPIATTVCINQITRERKDCGAHSLIVIGERTDDKNEKSFLIRNSWGPDWCPKKDSDIECEGGQVWVKEKRFVPAVRMMFTFDQN